MPVLFNAAVNHALSRFGLRERGTAPFPRQPAPMLVEKATTLFDDSAWTYESKWDGLQVLRPKGIDPSARRRYFRISMPACPRLAGLPS